MRGEGHKGLVECCDSSGEFRKDWGSHGWVSFDEEVVRCMLRGYNDSDYLCGVYA